MAKRECKAAGCGVKVDAHFLMCPKHWRMVSPIIQHAVWWNYRPGQEHDLMPSKSWVVASMTAIAEVAEKEGRCVKCGAQSDDIQHTLQWDYI